MLYRFIISITVVFLALSASAKECLLEAALKDPKIYNNTDFWEDYSKLKSTEDTKEVSALLKKHGYEGDSVSPSGGSSAAASSNRSLSLSIDKKAEKEVSLLQPNLRGKVDEFISIVSKPNGIKEIRDNPGRWRLEKLNNSGNLQTVRLNDGYRIMFEVKGDELNILRVNKAQIHDHPF